LNEVGGESNPVPKARKLKNLSPFFFSISSPYEPPLDPNVVIESQRLNEFAAAEKILNAIENSDILSS